jgi:succinyl-CoA synthetase beta subunit
MGFETKILDVVSEVLGTTHKAEFTCGILYITDITPVEAEELWAAIPCDAMVRTYVGMDCYKFTF